MTHLIQLVHDLILYKMEKGELNLESKEALKSVLQEYEAHIKLIEHQLEMCKKDHTNLKDEIARLMAENQDLFQQLQYRKDNPVYKRDKSDISSNSDFDNLQQQFSLVVEEKEALEGLWKSSLKEVDILKEKLKNCQSGKQLTMVQSKLSDAQQDYTEAIKLLESRLSATKKENNQLFTKAELLEAQMSKVTSEMALITEKNYSLNNSLKECSANEKEWKSRFLGMEAKYIELERTYQADKVKFANVYEYEKVESNLKEKLEGALKQRDELQTALERCHERLAELLRNAASDRSRVEEAVALVEGAMQGRQEALDRESQSVEEVKKIKTELNKLVEEVGLRVGQETAALKHHFDNQLIALKDQLQVVEQDRNRKSVEVKQLQSECDRLQALLDEEKKHSVPDKRDKHLDRVYHELHQMESEVLQLRMENEALHDSINKLQDKCIKYRRDKGKLKLDLQNSEQQSQLYQHELAVTNQRAELLNSQLNLINLELAQLHSEALIDRDNASNAQAKVSVANTLELYKRLDDSYRHMNDKWKKEISALTEKFEEKFKKLKAKTNRHACKDEPSKKPHLVSEYMSEYNANKT